MIEYYKLKRNKLFLVGMFMFATVLFCAAFPSLITFHNPMQGELKQRLKAPSANHIFGTDHVGRDLLTRVVYGAGLSVRCGLSAIFISAMIGVPLGILAGYRGGGMDTLLMRLTDLLLSFPSFLLAMLVVAILGLGLQNAVVAVGISYIGPLARLVRGSTIKVKNTEFIEAAYAIGSSGWHNVIRHIIPNIVSPLMIQLALNFGTSIVDIAGLSFLGLGAQPPTPEWGAMLASGRHYVRTSWWLSTFPGFAIMYLVLACVFIGDGLREILDPKHK